MLHVEGLLQPPPLPSVRTRQTRPFEVTGVVFIPCGRRITSMPHTISNDEISDPTFGVPPIKDIAKRQGQLIQHFQTRWKKEYLTSLREYHKNSGATKQQISIGDVIIVHDGAPRINWKLAVVEKLITGLDGITRATEIRTVSGRTNRPITKLFPLEVNDSTESQPVSQSDVGDDIHDVSMQDRPTRDATVTARERLKEWANTLSAAPEDVAN